MIPHFWAWFFGLPTTALFLALVSMGLFRIADHCADPFAVRGSFFFATGMCLALVGYFVLLACAGALLLFLVAVTFQVLHVAGIM